MINFLKKINSSQNIFLYSSLLIVITFLITRLPFYIYYPIYSLSSDSASYCAVALKILNGHAPLFDMRTPAYPLFLSFIWIFNKSFLSVTVIQSLLTLISSLFFLWSLSQSYKSLTLYFAIAISIFMSSAACLVFDLAILTESLFVNILMINSSLLVLSLKRNKTRLWVLYSTSIALLILLRPVGMFLIPIIFIIFIFFLFNKYKLKNYISIIIPILIILLILCTYNYNTLKEFTITPQGELNFAGLTMLYIETSPEYPENVNRAIKNTIDAIPRKDKSYVRDSYGLAKIFNILENNFFRNWILVDNLIKEDSSFTYMKIQPILRQISTDAFKKHPDIYTKIFISNFYAFSMNVTKSVSSYDELIPGYKKNVLEKQYIKELEGNEWRQFYSEKNSKNEVINLYIEQITEQINMDYIEYNSDGTIKFKDSFLKQTHIFYEKISNLLFRNILWVIVYFIVFLLSIYRVFESKFRNVDYFIPFIFSVMFISKTIFISLLSISLSRYSYTAEFIIYLSLPFLILLLKNSRKNSSTKIS